MWGKEKGQQRSLTRGKTSFCHACPCLLGGKDFLLKLMRVLHGSYRSGKKLRFLCLLASCPGKGFDFG